MKASPTLFVSFMALAILILLVVQLTRVWRDAAFAKQLRRIVTGESANREAIAYVAKVLARSTPSANARLIQKLFPIGVDASDVKQLWRAWHRVHIPAYVMMETRDNPERQSGFIKALFDGLATSTSRVIESRRHEGDVATSWITFDEFWPVVECLEEAAVHTHPANNELFASHLSRFAMSCLDETVHAQLGWVVNELLERSPHEVILGQCIAATLSARSSSAREALNTLVEYKRIGHGSLQGDALQLAEVVRGVDRIAVLQDSDYHERCEEQRATVLTFKVKQVNGRIDAAMTANPGDIVHITGQGCDEILLGAGPCSGVHGIIALAAVRLVLRHLCRQLEEVGPVTASQIAQDACRWLMARADTGRVPAFLVIESAESIRDHRTSDAAEAMASFLKSNPGALDPGIAVCISEGIEDGLFETSEGENDTLKRERLADAIFVPDVECRWRVPNVDSKLDDIRVFWRDAAESLQQNAIERDDVPRWMNTRLDLRRDAAA
jgi:hypothetical protein